MEDRTEIDPGAVGLDVSMPDGFVFWGGDPDCSLYWRHPQLDIIIAVNYGELANRPWTQVGRYSVLSLVVGGDAVAATRNDMDEWTEVLDRLAFLVRDRASKVEAHGSDYARTRNQWMKRR